MNEINQVVILAAGRSRRMESLSNKKPKCLFEYNGELVLTRLVRQIRECGVEKIVITTGYKATEIEKVFKDDKDIVLVENKLYEEDVNIYSMKLALSKIDGPFVIFEADVLMEDSLVKYALGSDFENKSVWFTKGKFNQSQYGGILKSDKYGNVDDIKYVSVYEDKYDKYSKLTGLMRVSSNELPLFKKLINKYADNTIKQYYLVPWMENLSKLPCLEADISKFSFFTFNKPEEYYQVLNKNLDLVKETPKIEMVDVSNLRPIESYDENRVLELIKKIEKEDMWTVPLIIEKKYNMILDGHHRFEVAKRLKLKKVPAIIVDYNYVDVWSLRKEIKISPNNVKKMVIDKKQIYPYKTVKHKYNFIVPTLDNVTLESLKND